MQQLHRLITRLGLASVSEVNKAIFSFPDLGIVEALAQTLGQAREQAVLERVAAELNLHLLPDVEVQLPAKLPSSCDLARLKDLIRAHKTLPVQFGQLHGKKTVLLAMADPTNEQAIRAFAAFFCAEANPALAREWLIAKAVEKLQSCAAQEQTLEGSKAKENLEVLKALQQVTATAIKHAVEKVEIDLDTDYVQARFFLPDGSSSSVEISVSTDEIAAAFLRRGQVIARSANAFQAACCIEFKSSGVNCMATFDQEYATEHASQVGTHDSDTAISRRALIVSDFVIDAPDDPAFWLSILRENEEQLRKLIEEPTGVIIVASPDEEARTLALRALARSCPDAYGPFPLVNLKESGEILMRGHERRVLIGSTADSVFSITELLQGLPRNECDAVRAVVSYRMLPRLCECCAERADVPSYVMAKVPDYIKLGESNFRRSRGCSICDQKGTLGCIGVTSILDLHSMAGKTLKSGASRNELATALAREPQFQTLIANGVKVAAQGSTPLQIVLQELPSAPEEYETAFRKLARFGEGEGPLEIEAQFEEDSVARKNGTTHADGRPNGNLPVSGSAVFAKDPNAEKERPRPESAPAPKIVPEPSTLTKSQHELLLVIDDDPDQRAILRKVFELEGYRVETASDGVDGIVSANRLQPHVIVVDFMMPELDGRETIKRLKQSPQTAKIPIVALTAYADPDVEYGLLKAGADDFCPKSVSKKVLLKRIQRLVGRA